MKCTHALVLFALSTCALRAAEVPTMHAQLPTDLAQSVADFDRAQSDGDGSALGRLLADDFVLLNSRAELENKADFIRDYTAPGWKLMPFVVQDEIVRTWPEGAVLGGLVTLRGTDNGKPFVVRLHFADIWRKLDGHWQVIYTQAIRAPAT